MLEYQVHSSTKLGDTPVLKKIKNDTGTIEDQLFTLKQEIINQSQTHFKQLKKKEDDIAKLESLIQDYERLNQDSQFNRIQSLQIASGKIRDLQAEVENLTRALDKKNRE